LAVVVAEMAEAEIRQRWHLAARPEVLELAAAAGGVRAHTDLARTRQQMAKRVRRAIQFTEALAVAPVAIAAALMW
jgi:hypothetical protein